MQLTWTQFKTLIVAHNLPIYLANDYKKYNLSSMLDSKEFFCGIHKTQEDYATDKADFEANWLTKCNIPSGLMQNPFASKKIGQYKLFRRKHGNSATAAPDVNGEVIFDLTVPYTRCKINEIEIIGATEGMTADLKVMMGVTQLNQFGFDVAICKDYYKDHSDYDADLQAGLTVRLVLKSVSQTKFYGVNITLHEMVTV